MFKISRLETRFQEIVFFNTLVFAMTMAMGGVFYLTLTPAGFLAVSGEWGSRAIQFGFQYFGYTYFVGVILVLHLGHLILGHSQQLKDLFFMRIMIIRSFLLGLSAMILIASLISVVEIFNGIPPNRLLISGTGGWFGFTVGGFLAKNFGLVGALVLLFSVTTVLSIAVGFMEVVHSIYLMKEIIGEGFRKIFVRGPQYVKGVGDKMVEFVEQRPQYQAAGGVVFRKSTPPPWAGNGFETNHFHIPCTGATSTNPVKESLDSEESATEGKVPSKSVQKTLKNNASKLSNSADTNVLTDGEKPSGKLISKKSVATEKNGGNPESIDEDQEEGDLLVEPWTKRYKKVDVRLLEKSKKTKLKSEYEMKKVISQVEARLASFGINGEIIDYHLGVTLTMFEFRPAAGVKVSKFQSLSDDLALVLGAKSIRILAPIPGKTTVGFEIPNDQPGMLRVSDLVPEMLKQSDLALPVILGMDVYNRTQIADLTKMPHMLVAGTTGSGKSVFTNTLISGLIMHKSPKDLRFLMIDPKMIELSPYNGIPHLLKPVVTDVDEAKNTLLWAEKEMDRRYKIFSDLQSKNITTFNEKVKKTSKRAVETRLGRKISWSCDTLPYIVIVIDELADLMLTQGKEVERPITRIAQKARAAGIHMVMATQRPSTDIVTGLIKTNFPTRVSFKVSSSIDSRTIVDQTGAEKLLGLGDMLFQAQGKSLERLQGSFISEDEVRKIVSFVTLENPKKTPKKK